MANSERIKSFGITGKRADKHLIAKREAQRKTPREDRGGKALILDVPDAADRGSSLVVVEFAHQHL